MGEDKREIIKYIKTGTYRNDWVAWLEKQEQVKDSAIFQHENKMCKENGDSLTNGDEKVRRELLAVVDDLILPDEQHSRFVTWLEKQGEISSILSNSSNIGKNTWREKNERVRKALITYFQRFPYDSLEDAGINAKDAIAWLEGKSALEAANEPADKIEPKFRPGDWA